MTDGLGPLPSKPALTWLPFLSVAGVTFLLCLYVVTRGTFRLFDPEPFGTFYDAQARSLIHGRVDVEPASLDFEAFVRDGKAYGYFGPTPALFRIPAQWLLPGFDGRWSRLSVLLGCLAGVGAAELLFRLAMALEQPGTAAPNGLIHTAFLLAAGLGSTNLFLTARAFVHHEALVWGSAFALLACWAAATYLGQPAGWRLFLTWTLAGLSLFSRGSTGAGPMLLLVLLGFAGLRVCRPLLPPARSIPRGHRALALSGAAVLVVAYVGLNYAKFGTFLRLPFDLHRHYDAGRLRRVEGRMLHLGNVVPNAIHYLSPDRIRLDPGFPWIGLARAPVSSFPAARFDRVEPYAGLPVTAPALCMVSLAGLCYILRSGRLASLRLPAVGALASSLTLFPLFYVSYRYVHDFYPFLVLTAAAGAAGVASLRSRGLRGAAVGLLLVAGAWSIFANFVFALEGQTQVTAVDMTIGRALRYRQLRGRIDDVFRLEPMAPIVTADAADAPRHPLRGQVWIAGPAKTVYWYNGLVWVPLQGPPFSYRANLRVEFREKSDGVEPLVSAGRPGSGSVVYVRYLPGGRIAVGLDRPGTDRVEGAPVDVAAGSSHRVEVEMDAPNGVVAVRLDGRRVLRYRGDLAPTDLSDVRVGENGVSDEVGKVFSGSIGLE